MKNLIVILFVFIGQISFAQTDSLKIKLSQDWTIKEYEQFGVIDEPNEEQRKDKVFFKPDNTCSITENGINYTGTWSIDKTKSYILCSLKNGAVKRNYKIISVKANKAIVEYQSPDLIRTKYHMTAE